MEVGEEEEETRSIPNPSPSERVSSVVVESVSAIGEISAVVVAGNEARRIGESLGGPGRRS